MTDWSFDAWPAIDPDWMHCKKHQPDDHVDFHVDLGCGRVKKGRIGVDRFEAPGVNVVMDLDGGGVTSCATLAGQDAPRPHVQHALTGWHPRVTIPRSWGLPFPDCSIESIVTHHCLEHIRDGFMPLMDDIYRVLKPGALFRVIVPLFPSHAAVGDQDHKRYFMEDSFDAFCGTPGDTPQNCWLAGFSVPYTNARFTKGDVYTTPLEPGLDVWDQHRELRVSLRAEK